MRGGNHPNLWENVKMRLGQHQQRSSRAFICRDNSLSNFQRPAIQNSVRSALRGKKAESGVPEKTVGVLYSTPRRVICFPAFQVLSFPKWVGSISLVSFFPQKSGRMPVFSRQWRIYRRNRQNLYTQPCHHSHIFLLEEYTRPPALRS